MPSHFTSLAFSHFNVRRLSRLLGATLWLGLPACSGTDAPVQPGTQGSSTTSATTATGNSATGTLTTGTTATVGGVTATSSTGTATTAGSTTATATATLTATSSTGATSSTLTGTASTGAVTGAGGSTGTSTSSSTTGGPPSCPVDATFCSSFDENVLPPGAVYKLNGDPATPWTTDFEIDTTVYNSGVSSLRVRPNTEGSGAYKMLAVPTPGAAFWARFYIRSDVDLGHAEHNVYAAAAGSDNPNEAVFVEFAEDVGLSFNSHDIVRWPVGFGRLEGGGTNPFTLPANTWHCIEISFDGQARVQSLSINGTQQINAPDYPADVSAFTTFKFGYNALHGITRNTWYDDVAVAAAPIGCT